jgi:hypothetical protein
MFTFKTALFTFLFVLLNLSLFSQAVRIKKETARIRNDYADGFEAELQATPEEAEAALSRLMKTFGKSKSNEDYIVVSAPSLQGRPYTNPVYGKAKQLGNIISVWVGLRKSDWSESEFEVVSRELETQVYNFTVTFHRDKIQKQIDESLQASQAVLKQQQRLITQNKNLNTKIESNKRQKIQLEKALEDNRIELESLTLRLEKNKKDQDSVAVAGEQIKKVIEMHRERQRKVN